MGQLVMTNLGTSLLIFPYLAFAFVIALIFGAGFVTGALVF